MQTFSSCAVQHLDIQPEQIMAPGTLDNIVRWLCFECRHHAAVFQLRIRDVGAAGAAVRAFQLGKILSVVGQFRLLSLYGKSFITFTATPCTTISSGHISCFELFSG